MASNNSAGVSVGKGVKGGYMYSADLTAALPTDYDSELGDMYEVLGYVSEDGIAEETDEDTTDIVDMNGDTVLTDTASYTKTFTCSLIETKAAVLKEYFGSDVVTDENGTIIVSEESGKRTNRIYVFELVMTGNRRERIIVPNGKVTEVGEITYAAGDAIGYEITITAFPDDAGHQTYRYIQSLETGEGA